MHGVKTHTQISVKNYIFLRYHAFSHPDCTVGFGISPNPPISNIRIAQFNTAPIPNFQIGSRARGYPHYRRLGISPDPEGDHIQLGYDQQIFNYY